MRNGVRSGCSPAMAPRVIEKGLIPSPAVPAIYGSDWCHGRLTIHDESGLSILNPPFCRHPRRIVNAPDGTQRSPGGPASTATRISGAVVRDDLTADSGPGHPAGTPLPQDQITGPLTA